MTITWRKIDEAFVAAATVQQSQSLQLLPKQTLLSNTVTDITTSAIIVSKNTTTTITVNTNTFATISTNAISSSTSNSNIVVNNNVDFSKKNIGNIASLSFISGGSFGDNLDGSIFVSSILDMGQSDIRNIPAIDSGNGGTLLLGDINQLFNGSTLWINAVTSNFYFNNGNLLVQNGNVRANAYAAAVNTVTNSSTLNIDNSTVFVNGAGKTITLPDATDAINSGRIYTVKLIAAATTCVLTTVSGQTIDNATTYTLSAQNKYATVQSDESNWKIIASN